MRGEEPICSGCGYPVRTNQHAPTCKLDASFGADKKAQDELADGGWKDGEDSDTGDLTGKLDVQAAIDSVVAYDDSRNIEKHERLKHEPFYIVKNIEAGVTFFGSVHTNDSQSETVQRLQTELDRYFESADSATASVMVEGLHSGDVTNQIKGMIETIETMDEAVGMYGERGAVLWYVKEARQKGLKVDILSPEKPEDEIISELKNDGFREGELAMYLTLRQLTSEIGQEHFSPETADEALQKFARIFFSIDQLTGADWIQDKKEEGEILGLLQNEPEVFKVYTRTVVEQYLDSMNAFASTLGVKDTIISSVENLISRNPDNVSMGDINELHDPLDLAGRDSVINRVSARWNTKRDEYLVEQIADAVNSEKKPFIVFGASHAIALEDSIEGLVK